MDNNKTSDNTMKRLSDEKSEISNIELLGKDVDKLKWYSVTDFAEWMKAATRQKGQEAIPHGNIHIKEYKSYYDTNNTITTALATNPSNPEHTGYNVESIFQHNQRNAEKVYVSNDGSDTLFVLVSHGGVEHSTRERPIYPGDVKTYYNVFELRLRSPTAGVPYRISEYEIETGTGNAGAGFAPIAKAELHNQALPGANVNWLATDISPTKTPTVFSISVAVSIAGNFQAVITNGGSAQTVVFNSSIGPALAANGVYIFDLMVYSGDTINFSYSTTTGTIMDFKVFEVDAMVG